MAKQKIVMKVPMEDSKKRAKALKTAVGSTGVISGTLDGDKIVVTGDGIDPISLTTTLRKRMGFAELVSVGDVEEKKEEEKKPKIEEQVLPPYYVQVVPQYPYYHQYEIRQPSYDSCTLM